MRPPAISAPLKQFPLSCTDQIMHEARLGATPTSRRCTSAEAASFHSPPVISHLLSRSIRRLAFSAHHAVPPTKFCFAYFFPVRRLPQFLGIEIFRHTARREPVGNEVYKHGFARPVKSRLCAKGVFPGCKWWSELVAGANSASARSRHLAASNRRSGWTVARDYFATNAMPRARSNAPHFRWDDPIPSNRRRWADRSTQPKAFLHATMTVSKVRFLLLFICFGEWKRRQDHIVENEREDKGTARQCEVPYIWDGVAGKANLTAHRDQFPKEIAIAWSRRSARLLRNLLAMASVIGNLWRWRRDAFF
jgi:hypothetical protein